MVGLLWEEVENSHQQAIAKNGWRRVVLGPRLGRTQPVWTTTRTEVPGKAPVWPVPGGAVLSHQWEFKLGI